MPVWLISAVPYLKKYWWLIAIVVFISAVVWRGGDVIEAAYAYKNPEVRIFYITKTVKQKDVVHTKETIIKVDGTKVIRERTEDKSREETDTNRREDKTPVAISGLNGFSHRIETEIDLVTKSPDLSYDFRYRHFGFGLTAVGLGYQDSNTAPITAEGGKMRVSYNF